MSETIYLPEVRCEVSEGLLDTDITVCVQDVKGWRQYMHVTPTMVNYYDGQPYLPVGLIQVDHKARRALIELPTEADSGANRMWIPFESFLPESKADPVAWSFQTGKSRRRSNRA